MGRRSRAKLFSPHSRNTGSPLVRRICLAAIGIILLLAALTVVGYYQLLAYLQGDSFRQSINESARHSLHAGQVELLSNLRIKSNRISLEGINLAHLRQVEMARATGINAEINRTALLGRHLHLHKLSMEDATLIINTGGKAATSKGKTSPRKQKGRQPAKKSKKNTTPARQPEPAGFALQPQSAQLDAFECRDTDLHLVHLGHTYQLLGASVTASPAPKIAPQAWQLHAENARFHTPFPFLRDSSIKSASVIYNGHHIDLTDSRIMLTPGEMRAKAHYDMQQHRWTADLQVNKGNLHRLLNEDWKKRLSGDLYGRLVLTGNKNGVGTATGNISLQNGILEALPILSQIPLGNTYPYRSIELEKSDCQVLFPYVDHQAGEAWLFDDINISAKGGILLVHGHILVGRDRRLGGTLTIGLPEQVIEGLPLSREMLIEKLFTASGPEEGYLWVKMNLSGTLDAPQEDLSIRLTTLLGKQLGDTLMKAPASLMLDTLFRRSETEEKATESGQPSDSPVETPIKAATEAAGSLLQSLF